MYFVFRRKHWRNLPGLICIYVFPAYVLSWGCIDKYRRGINNFSLKFLSICICGFELMTSPCDLYQFINPGCALGLPQALLPCWWWSSEIPSLIHKSKISLQQVQNISLKLKISLHKFPPISSKAHYISKKKPLPGLKPLKLKSWLALKTGDSGWCF